MASLRVLLDPTKLGRDAETLEDKLRKRVVGQDEAVRQIVDRYQTYVAGMCSTARPVGNFLFLGPTGSGKTRTKKRDIPEGLWTKCPSCSTMIFDKELDGNLQVCPKCQHHFPIASRERIHSLVETCTFEEMDAEMISHRPFRLTLAP